MHIPVVKDIIKYNQLVTFTSTFSALIKHDVFITDSMEILSKITENEIYKTIINDSIVNLSKGNGVSVAFKGHWAFPETAYEMLVTGEKTGKLGEMMEHVSKFYQEEQSNIIARLKRDNGFIVYVVKQESPKLQKIVQVDLDLPLDNKKSCDIINTS